jgi:hypothetical protein
VLPYNFGSRELQCSFFLVALTFTFVGHCRLGDIPDAGGVNPEVIKAILSSLLPTEGKLAITFFFFACTAKQVLVCDLLVTRAPGMRENRIWQDVVALKLGKAEATGTLELQKTHGEGTVA